VVIQHYISDNGSAFTSGDFAAHLEQFHQVSKFASAGACHHNGIGEQNIGTVLSITRAITPRSQRHMFLGISQDHTGDIPLVLNLDTGSTRTHYHVVVDNWFNTVHASLRYRIMFRNSNNRRRHVVHVVDQGSQFVTNEPGNKYLIDLMARITKRVHTAERDLNVTKPILTYNTYVGDELIEEIRRLLNTYSVSSDVKLTHELRYLKAMKKVLNQYAQPQSKRNGYMAQMTYMYACARTGTPGPFRAVGDEYHAAVRAMRITMMPLTDRHYWEMTNIIAGWEMTNIIAGWEMILLQLFNGHLKQHMLPEFLIGHGGSDSQDRKSRSRLVKVK